MHKKKRPAHTPLGYAWETFEKGKKVFDLGQYDASVEVFENALGQFNQLFEEEGIAMSNAAIAAALNNKGEPRLAIPYAMDSLDFYQRLDLKPQLAEQRQNIALMFTAMGMTRESEKYHVLAADSYEAFNQFEMAGQNKHTAANLYARRKKVIEARRYFTEAITLLGKANSPSAEYSKATALMQLAYLEKLAEDFDAARLLYAEALDLFVEMGSHWEVGTCYEGLAAVDFETENHEDAATHAKHALHIYRAHGFDHDARRAAANYRASLVAASFSRKGQDFDVRKQEGED